jgi:hypothetical protein
MEGFEILSDSPAFVISQSKSVLLEKGIYSGNTMVPRLLQIIKCQPSILRLRFLSFQRIFRPNSLRINKLALPGLNIPKITKK